MRTWVAKALAADQFWPGNSCAKWLRDCELLNNQMLPSMAAKRALLEADDFLAHRFVHDRMRDFHVWRFFVLDDLPASARADAAVRDRLLLRVIGSPDAYEKHIDGMG